MLYYFDSQMIFLRINFQALRKFKNHALRYVVGGVFSTIS